jgi:photosystem II stability/assembly factor-like uncharacterized protein
LLLITVSLQAEGPVPASKVGEPTNFLYLPLLWGDAPPPPTADWIGPGGGAITDLIFDPVNTNTAFAAASIGGIYKTTDGGVSWKTVSIGLENLDITAIGISALNPLVLYAGTYRGGFYKSADHGETWFRSDAGFQNEAITYAIEIDPTRTKRVYVSTRGESNGGAAPWNGKVYKSNDGGTSWSSMLTSVGGSSEEDWAYDLAIHPVSTNVVYASTHEHGVYLSEDYGGSWSAINIGITDSTGRAVEHDPDSAYPGKVYFGVFERTGIFKSLNGGGSWTLYNQNLSDTQIYKLSIDPGDVDNIYLATFTDGVMKTSNGGSNWNSIGLNDEIILDVVVNPGDGQKLLSGTLRNGLFRSTNGGGDWSHSMAGLNASIVSSLAIRLGDSNDMVAALTPGWLARSTDGGVTWSDYHTGIGDNYVNQLVTHPTLPQYVYALTKSSGLFLREIGVWDNWVRVDVNLPSAAPGTQKNLEQNDPPGNLEDYLFPEQPALSLQNKSLDGTVPLLTMVFDPAIPLTAYMGTDGVGVYKTSDDGETWTSSGLSGLTVRDLEFSPADPNLIYAATNGSGSVYLSPDSGGNWGNLILPGVTAYSLAIPPSDPDLIYAGTSSGFYIFDGLSWAASGLGGFEVYDLVLHPSNPDIIYAGTHNSAFISYDGGVNWELGPEELLGIRIESIHFDPNDPGVIYYNTRAHGVLRVSGN